MTGFPVHDIIQGRVNDALDQAGLPGPVLCVVVDTEEEFDWAAPFDPASTAVENIGAQDLAQRLFDRDGIRPTYAVDYPVATTASAIGVLRAYLDAGRCDIGAHLHPWVTPPAGEPIDARHSYACNLPPALMRGKLAALTEAITSAFGRPPAVYKAGRYGVDARTPDVLRELGYRADASVVPHTDFSADGGPDFRAMPAGPFLAAPGLLEVPLSVDFVGAAAGAGARLFPLLDRGRGLRLPGIAARLGVLERLRLSPEGHSAADMMRQTRAAMARGTRLFALTYHSSTLLPGGSPYARDRAERDRFVATLDRYLQVFMALPQAGSITVRALADRVLGPDAGQLCFASDP